MRNWPEDFAAPIPNHRVSPENLTDNVLNRHNTIPARPRISVRKLEALLMMVVGLFLVCCAVSYLTTPEPTLHPGYSQPLTSCATCN